MLTLYHFTCAHRAVKIAADNGTLLPAWQPFLRASLVWMTVDPGASAAALGMATHALVTCDRMEFRYRIDEPYEVVPWIGVARYYPRAVTQALHAAHGARPSSWYVSRSPQQAMMDDGARSSWYDR